MFWGRLLGGGRTAFSTEAGDHHATYPVGVGSQPKENQRVLPQGFDFTWVEIFSRLFFFFFLRRCGSVCLGFVLCEHACARCRPASRSPDDQRLARYVCLSLSVCAYCGVSELRAIILPVDEMFSGELTPALVDALAELSKKIKVIHR